MTKKVDDASVHYVHVRVNEGGFGFMTKESLRPVGTLAIQNRNDGYVVVALAMCNPKDNFCYKTGRHKAFGRLFSKDASHRGILSLEEFRNQVNSPEMGFLSMLSQKYRSIVPAWVSPRSRFAPNFSKSLLCIAEDIEKGLK